MSINIIFRTCYFYKLYSQDTIWLRVRCDGKNNDVLRLSIQQTSSLNFRNNFQNRYVCYYLVDNSTISTVFKIKAVAIIDLLNCPTKSKIVFKFFLENNRYNRSRHGRHFHIKIGSTDSLFNGIW